MMIQPESPSIPREGGGVTGVLPSSPSLPSFPEQKQGVKSRHRFPAPNYVSQVERGGKKPTGIPGGSQGSLDAEGVGVT